MRKAFAVAALAAAAFASSAPAAVAAPLPRQVALFIVHGMSFEQFMAVPQFRALARAGGAGLMSFRTVRGDAGPGRLLTLGTGARSEVPFPVSRIASSAAPGFRLIGFHQIVEQNLHRSVPGLLASVLAARGIRSCAFTAEAGLVVIDRRGISRLCGLMGKGRSLHLPGGLDVGSVPGSPGKQGREIEQTLRRYARGSLRVIVLEASPSRGMLAHNDELSPIVVADGTPRALFDHRGPMHSLTSDTTRRDGVVSNEDVAPTILSSFGIATPADMNGTVIRTIDAGPPFELHRRHLGERRLTVPIQVGLGIAELVVGLLALLVLWRKPRLPDALARRAAALPLAMAVLGVAALAAGGLPTISYGWVVPFLVTVPVISGVAAMELRRRGTLVPAAAIATAILVFFAVEGAQGWPDTPTTLFGGSALDGARFYGMPNIEVGLVLGAALWVAAILPTYEGFVLLVAAGLFAGFPDLGVNFGAAVTMFAAAGLWLGIRGRRRLGWRELIVAGIVIAAGMAVVVGANLVWAKHPTHGTRFVEHASSRGWSGLVRFVWDRLLVGWHLLLHAPLAWVPVLGLLPALYLLLKPSPTLKNAFSRYPAWRDALLVMVLASMVAYVANDSGAAAVGWGFGLALAGMLYVPLVEESWRTDTATR